MTIIPLCTKSRFKKNTFLNLILFGTLSSVFIDVYSKMRTKGEDPICKYIIHSGVLNHWFLKSPGMWM